MLNSVTVPSGSYGRSETFTAIDGGVISTTFVGGTWDSEITYSFTDSFGDVIFTTPNFCGSMDCSIANVAMVFCPGPAGPSCAYVLQMRDSLGDGAFSFFAHSFPG